MAANVVMAIIADFMLVWLPAPTLSYAAAASAGKLNLFSKLFAGCPDNAFQKVQPGMPAFTLLQRMGAPVRNGLKLACVGFSASMIGVCMTNALIALRTALDPSFAPLNQSQDVIATSLAYGAYMATSSNIRCGGSRSGAAAACWLSAQRATEQAEIPVTMHTFSNVVHLHTKFAVIMHIFQGTAAKTCMLVFQRSASRVCLCVLSLLPAGTRCLLAWWRSAASSRCSRATTSCARCSASWCAPATPSWAACCGWTLCGCWACRRPRTDEGRGGCYKATFGRLPHGFALMRAEAAGVVKVICGRLPHSCGQ